MKIQTGSQHRKVVVYYGIAFFIVLLSVFLLALSNQNAFGVRAVVKAALATFNVSAFGFILFSSMLSFRNYWAIFSIYTVVFLILFFVVFTAFAPKGTSVIEIAGAVWSDSRLFFAVSMISASISFVMLASRRWPREKDRKL